MNIAPHAAVDLAIRQARKNGLQRQASFLNALLRRSLRESGAEHIARIPASAALPKWMQAQWRKDYGADIAEKIAAASLAKDGIPLDCTVYDPAAQALLCADYGTEKIAGHAVRFENAPNLTTLPPYKDGQLWVQDGASSAPIALLGDLKGLTALDVCAAPGGKTMQLIAQGADVTALDISAKRLERMTQNLTRTKTQDRVTMLQEDFLSFKADKAYDLIVLDAPCSATGTLRRNPDILHSTDEDAMRSLLPLQARMLDHAYSLLKEGGTVLYCTCSLQKAEGEDQISAFLERNKNAQALPFDADHPAVNKDGYFRSLPGSDFLNGHCDGFFAARLTKKR